MFRDPEHWWHHLVLAFALVGASLLRSLTSSPYTVDMTLSTAVLTVGHFALVIFSAAVAGALYTERQRVRGVHNVLTGSPRTDDRPPRPF